MTHSSKEVQMSTLPAEAATAVPNKRYAVTVRNNPTFDIAELEFESDRLVFSKKVRKTFEPWFHAPYSSIASPSLSTFCPFPEFIGR